MPTKNRVSSCRRLFLLLLLLLSQATTVFNCIREPRDIGLLETIPQILAPLPRLLLFRSKSGGGLTERQEQYKICLPVDHFVVVQRHPSRHRRRREDCQAMIPSAPATTSVFSCSLLKTLSSCFLCTRGKEQQQMRKARTQ